MYGLRPRPRPPLRPLAFAAWLGVFAAACSPLDDRSRDCETLCTAVDALYDDTYRATTGARSGEWEYLYCRAADRSANPPYPFCTLEAALPTTDPICIAAPNDRRCAGVPVPHVFVDPDYIPAVRDERAAAARSGGDGDGADDPRLVKTYCDKAVTARPRYTKQACLDTCAEQTRNTPAPGTFARCLQSRVINTSGAPNLRCAGFQACVKELWDIVRQDEL